MKRHEFMSEIKKDIKKLIELNGLFVGMDEAILQHVDQLKKVLKENDISPESIERVTTLVEKTFKDGIHNEDFMNTLIKAHERQLNQDQVQELLEFLQSEKMVKATSMMRVLNAEMVTIGTKWMEEQSAKLRPEFDRVIIEEREKRMAQVKQMYKDVPEKTSNKESLITDDFLNEI